MTQRSRRALRFVEGCLLLFCLGVAAYVGSVAVQAGASQKASSTFGAPSSGHQPERQHDDSPAQANSSQPLSPGDHAAGGVDVIGRLDVPSLNLSVPILADFQAKDLLQGVGHVPGTAMPGGLGTMGLAGHRDTYFRPLRGIKPKMDMRVSDATGTYHYEVDNTEIVQPEDVQVLDIHMRPELTLITCYPFNFIGAAPQRFIVHAHLVSALPD